MSREIEVVDQQFLAITASDRSEGAIEIGTDASVIVIAGDLQAFIRRITDAVTLLETDDARDERECSRCGDEVLVLNSRDECLACEVARAAGDVCSRCDQDVDWDPALGAYREAGVTICGSCAHNERRSG